MGKSPNIYNWYLLHKNLFTCAMFFCTSYIFLPIKYSSIPKRKWPSVHSSDIRAQLGKTAPTQSQRISLGLLKFRLINSKPGVSSILLGFVNLLGQLQGCRESLRISPETAWDKVHGGRQVWPCRAPSGLIKSNCSSVYRTHSPASPSFQEIKVLLQRLARVPTKHFPLA